MLFLPRIFHPTTVHVAPHRSSKLITPHSCIWCERRMPPRRAHKPATASNTERSGRQSGGRNTRNNSQRASDKNGRGAGSIAQDQWEMSSDEPDSVSEPDDEPRSAAAVPVSS